MARPSSGAQPTKAKPLAVMSVYGRGVLLVVEVLLVLMVLVVLVVVLLLEVLLLLEVVLPMLDVDVLLGNDEEDDDEEDDNEADCNTEFFA